MNRADSESAARKRYKNRGLYPEPKTDRELFLNDLSHRLIPSFSYYVSSLLAGICCGLALLLNAKPLFILAAALIPFCGPFLGIALSCVTGSLRFFWQSFFKYLLAVLLFFCGGFIVGLFSHTRPAPDIETLRFFSNVEPISQICVSICAFLAVVFLSKSLQQMPQSLCGGMMFFVMMPAGIAGYALSAGLIDQIAANLGAWFAYGFFAVLSAITALLILRMFNAKAGSLIMSGLVYLCALALFLNTLGFLRPSLEERLRPSKNEVLHVLSLATYTPTLTPTPTFTLTPSPTATFTLSPDPTATATLTFTPTATQTAVPPTHTATSSPTVTPSMTPTRTLIPSKTPTLTVIASPTLIYGIVYVRDDIGLLVRKNPSFTADVIKSQYNDSILEMLDEAEEHDGILWVKVRTNEGYEGWVSAAALRTATPNP